MALYNDNFTNTNGTLLTAHTADSGATYSGAAGVSITSNRIHNSDSSTNYVDSNVTSDSEYDLDVIFVTQSNIEGFGITFGKVDDNNFYLVRMQAGSLQLYKWIAGTPTLLDSYIPTVSPPAILDNTKIKVRSGSINIDYGVTTNVITSPDTALSRVGIIGYRGNGLSASNTGHFIDSVDYTNQSVTGPTITDIDTDDDVFDGQTTALTGTALGANGGTLDIGDVAQTVASNNATAASITIVQDHLNYGLHDAVWTDTLDASSAAFPVTISPITGFQFVVAASPISDNTSLFFGVIPVVVTGDQLETPLLTDQGKAITLHADGTFIIVGAGSSKQTFQYRIHDISDSSWSNYAAVVINGIPTNITPFDAGSYALRSYIRKVIFHSKLIIVTRGRAEEYILRDAMVVLGGTSMIPPVDGVTPEPGWLGTQTVSEFEKRIARLPTAQEAEVVIDITSHLTALGWT